MMNPGEAFRLISETMPEELRGERVDAAFGILYDTVRRDLERGGQ
jgi:hypothetical protein